MNLLFILNGKKEVLYKVHNLNPDDTDIIKIDDKHLSKPSFISSKISEKSYNNVFFGSKDIGLQRFQIFMLFYILKFCKGNGYLIDEKGNIIKSGWFKLLFYLVPLLAFEGIVSSFVILYFYIKLPLMRWKFNKIN